MSLCFSCWRSGERDPIGGVGDACGKCGVAVREVDGPAPMGEPLPLTSEIREATAADPDLYWATAETMACADLAALDADEEELVASWKDVVP